LGLLLLFVYEVALAAGGGSNGIPFKESGPDLVGNFIKSIIVLIFLAVLAVVGLVVARRYLPGLGVDKLTVKGQRIKLLEVRRLSPRATLFLIELDGKEMLLAQGDNITRLDRGNGSGVNSAPLTGGQL
jgi:hypothetical protein